MCHWCGKFLINCYNVWNGIHTKERIRSQNRHSTDSIHAFCTHTHTHAHSHSLARTRSNTFVKLANCWFLASIHLSEHTHMPTAQVSSPKNSNNSCYGDEKLANKNHSLKLCTLWNNGVPTIINWGAKIGKKQQLKLVDIKTTNSAHKSSRAHTKNCHHIMKCVASIFQCKLLVLFIGMLGSSQFLFASEYICFRLTKKKRNKIHQ